MLYTQRLIVERGYCSDVDMGLTVSSIHLLIHDTYFIVLYTQHNILLHIKGLNMVYIYDNT